MRLKEMYSQGGGNGKAKGDGRVEERQGMTKEEVDIDK